MGTLGKTLPSRARSLVGERFGRVLVTVRAENSPSGNARWHYVCDCGTVATAFGTDLNRGRTTSCGCGSSEATSSRHGASRVDLTGRVFGRLTVVAFAGVIKSRARWECACECGETSIVSGTRLLDGSTTACGCYRAEGVSKAQKGVYDDVVQYQSAHGRVKSIHGSASTHLCVDCLNPAQDWSYDHEDADQLRDERGRPYSLKPEHYWPRCRSCHKFFDSIATRASGEVAREGERA